uniref:Uncharacterized protein n=1 Tax=Rhizophora mucronata TaxID=61149 RepID=A0A2P2P4X0_RHIMU
MYHCHQIQSDAPGRPKENQRLTNRGLILKALAHKSNMIKSDLPA